MPMFGAALYSPEVRAKALEMIQTLRPRVVLPDDALKGTRFNSDDRILWELESRATEDKFIEDPAFHVCAALVESAKSDHWYNSHECDYKWRDDDDYDDEDNYVEE